jgi:hypothetical protein
MSAAARIADAVGHRARSEKCRAEVGRFIDRFAGAFLLEKFVGLTRKGKRPARLCIIVGP